MDYSCLVLCVLIFLGVFIQNLNFAVFRDLCLWFFCVPENAISAIRKEGATKQNNTLLQMVGCVF